MLFRSPPKLAITAPADGAVLGSSNVTVTGTASDDRGVLRVELSIDDSTWVPAAGTTSWTCTLLLQEGRNTILARVLDTSGNRNITAIIVNVVIPDVTPPTVTITSPAEGSVLSYRSVNVSGTARDNKGVARVDVSLDNITWYPGTLTDRWTSALVLVEGRNTIYARAIDISGNIGLASIGITVVIPDTTPPALTILGPANGSTTSSASIEVKGEARDDGAVLKVEASLDGVNWKPCSGNDTWSVKFNLKEGKNTIFIRASDAAGNTCTATLVFTFNKPGGPRQINWLLIIVVVILLVVVLALLAHGIRRHRRRRRRRGHHR